VEEALAALDSGEARVAEKGTDGWRVNQWLKKAVLLGFRLNPMETIAGGPAALPGGTRCLRSSAIGMPRASPTPFSRGARRDRPARRLSGRNAC
jgi:hypothetical protein